MFDFWKKKSFLSTWNVLWNGWAKQFFEASYIMKHFWFHEIIYSFIILSQLSQQRELQIVQ